MSHHLISVILPTYNRGAILAEAIESVLYQTYRNIELIIVDDGSRDNTVEVLRSLNDSRIRVVRHEKNKGAYCARNAGIHLARGRYIAFQDSDDRWVASKLREEVDLIQDSGKEIGAVYSRLEKTFLDGRRVCIPDETFSLKDGNLSDVFLRGDFFITLQALLIKKECFEIVGLFDENLSLLGDMEFLLRFSRLYDFLYNNHVRIFSRVSQDSHSQNNAERLKSRDYIFQKHIKEFKKDPKIFAKNAYIIGNAYALRGDMEKARPYLRTAFIRSFFTVKYLAAFLFSFIGSPKLYRKAAALYTKLSFKKKERQEIAGKPADDFADHGTPDAPKRN